MPKLTALIHVSNEALTLEQTLKSLRPCDEVLVISHDSQQEIAGIAKQHGAALKQAIVAVDNGAYVTDAHNDWILCLQPGESLSNELQASLEEWKKTDPGSTVGYMVGIRDKTSLGKRPHELRLRRIITCVPSKRKGKLERDCNRLAAIHPYHPSRTISLRTHLRQLFECVHLPHAAGPLRSCAPLGVPTVQGAYSRLRQYSGAELDSASWPLP